jgi:hypothetical protein
MTYHTGTLTYPISENLGIPGVDYQCELSVNRFGDLVIESMEVALWNYALNSFDWVEPNNVMSGIIEHNVGKMFREGRLDISVDDKPNPAKLTKGDLL